MYDSEHQRIEAALRYLVEHRTEQPDLATAAAQAGFSPHHFQRVFSRRVGVSPKRFLQYLTATDACRLLRRRTSLLETSLAVGLSGSGRLHDLFLSVHGMTPAEYRARGASLEIRWGCIDSPFGRALGGFTSQGICWLSFHDHDGIESGLDEMQREWSRATLRRADDEVGGVLARIFSPIRDRHPIHIVVKGTNVQIRVWEALLRIPVGATCTYGDIARELERPGASRAVGSAIGANLVSWLIPCHRVIRGDGLLGGYRWGPHRKCMMLAHEATDADAAPNHTDAAHEQVTAGS